MKPINDSHAKYLFSHVSLIWTINLYSVNNHITDSVMGAMNMNKPYNFSVYHDSYAEEAQHEPAMFADGRL